MSAADAIALPDPDGEDREWRVAEVRDLGRNFAAVAAFQDDMVRSAQRSRRVAWWVAGAATVAACGLAASTAWLGATQNVVPLMFLVDRHSGEVAIQDTVAAGPASIREAVLESVIWNYVQAVEEWHPDFVARRWQTVQLLSTGPVIAQYQRMMDARNPDSPMVAVGRRGTVGVTLHSIAVRDAQYALVAYAKAITVDGMTRTVAMQAQVRFNFIDKLPSLAARRMNPTGFVATGFQSDMTTPAGTVR